MQNSMLMFAFCVFNKKYFFFERNLIQKMKIVRLGQTLVPRLIPSCRMQWGWFTSSVFNMKKLFWADNLMPILIRICRIQWWSSIFFVFDRKDFLGINLVQEIKTVYLGSDLLPRIILICRVQWWCSLLPFATRNTIFGKWSLKKVKIVSLRLNNSNMQNSIVISIFFSFSTEHTLFWQTWFQNSKMLFCFEVKFGT